MSSSDKYPLILAVLGGLAGFVDTLRYSDIVAALNTKRPLDDQIPFGISSWDDLKKTGIQGCYYWKVLREFHREFPGSKMCYWSLASIAWMFLLSAIAAGSLFLVRWTNSFRSVYSSAAPAVPTLKSWNPILAYRRTALSSAL